MNDLSLASFEIDQKLTSIGQGQFSTVFKAKVKDSGDEVALKKLQIFEMKTAKARADYIQEVEHLKNIEHPCLVRYLGSFTEEFDYYVILELIEGGDLATLLNFQRKSRSYLLESTVWVYFEQICSAIKHLHEARIMHRDIKLANIFITMDGKLKVGDIGPAKYFNIQNLESHTFVCTPYYMMCPERLTKEDSYSFSSDIWALGCVLYELAMCRNPFYADSMNMEQLFRLIQVCNYPSISRMYSQGLHELVDNCLSPNPEKRPNVYHLHQISFRMKDKFLKKKAISIV